MFRTYSSKIDKLLSEKSSKTDWREVQSYHKLMIARIQHERLIHLWVTIAVGLVMFLSSFWMIAFEKSTFLFIFVPTLALFIPYVFHYRFLENTTQKWYLLEDEIKKKIE